MGHQTVASQTLSECSNYRTDYQSSVAGPASYVSLALRRKMVQSQDAYLESSVWRAVSSHSSHHPQLGSPGHKGGLKTFIHSYMPPTLNPADKEFATK